MKANLLMLRIRFAYDEENPFSAVTFSSIDREVRMKS